MLFWKLLAIQDQHPDKKVAWPSGYPVTNKGTKLHSNWQPLQRLLELYTELLYIGLKLFKLKYKTVLKSHICLKFLPQLHWVIYITQYGSALNKWIYRRLLYRWPRHDDMFDVNLALYKNVWSP